MQENGDEKKKAQFFGTFSQYGNVQVFFLVDFSAHRDKKQMHIMCIYIHILLIQLK